VSYPGLEDPESGYVRVLLEYLPNGARGLMIATLLAAFMSTVDTQLNWGASYLTHDVFSRFVDREASERTLVRVARISVVVLAAVGAGATLLMPSIAGAWKFLASITAGSGVILLLRWLWWRINAWSEIAVMAASLLVTNALLLWSDVPFPFSLVIVVGVSLPVAFAVTLLTEPETSDTLRRFYRRVQPRGAWAPVARDCGLPVRPLRMTAWLQVGAATLGVYGLLLGTGWLLLGRPGAGAAAVITGTLLLALAVRGAATASPRSPEAPRRN
jgi:hypothetical protein